MPKARRRPKPSEWQRISLHPEYSLPVSIGKIVIGHKEDGCEDRRHQGGPKVMHLGSGHCELL